MEKKGFVFVESLTVLIIVILSLTLLLASYSLVIRKSKENEYYDIPSDKYLVYSISNLGDTGASYNTEESFVADKTNCSTYLSNRMTDCRTVFAENNIVYFAIIKKLKSELCDENVTSTYKDSGLIEYLKTLKRCKDSNNNGDGYNSGSNNKCSVTCDEEIGYAVGVFYRNGNYYYASLELE